MRTPAAQAQRLRQERKRDEDRRRRRATVARQQEIRGRPFKAYRAQIEQRFVQGLVAAHAIRNAAHAIGKENA